MRNFMSTKDKIFNFGNWYRRPISERRTVMLALRRNYNLRSCEQMRPEIASISVRHFGFEYKQPRNSSLARVGDCLLL